MNAVHSAGLRCRAANPPPQFDHRRTSARGHRSHRCQSSSDTQRDGGIRAPIHLPLSARFQSRNRNLTRPLLETAPHETCEGAASHIFPQREGNSSDGWHRRCQPLREEFLQNLRFYACAVPHALPQRTATRVSKTIASSESPIDRQFGRSFGILLVLKQPNYNKT